MAFSKDVKNLVILFSVSNLGSCSDEMGWFMVQNMSTNFEVFSKSSMLASFVDCRDLLGMLSLSKAYPYLGLEWQAHSSFYLKGLN